MEQEERRRQANWLASNSNHILNNSTHSKLIDNAERAMALQMQEDSIRKLSKIEQEQ